MKVGKRFIFLLAVIPAFFSCVTNLDGKEENNSNRENPELNNYFLHINLGSTAFSSRAALEEPGIDVENYINNLLLLFYRSGSNGPYVNKSFFIDSPAFSDVIIEYPSRYLDLPSYVIAFANFNPEEIENIINNVEGSVFTSFSIDDGIPMSSVRYFDSKGKPVFYTALNPKNFTEGLPVDLYIERAVAKLTLEKGSDLKIDPVILRSGKDELTLIFEPDSWGVTATDAFSYYLKNISTFGYNELNSILGTDGEEWKWNHPLLHSSSETSNENHDFPVLHWAVSPCYFMESFPDAEDSGQTSLDFVRFSELCSLQSESDDIIPLYVNETSRPAEAFNLKNGLPYIVLGGHYIVEGNESAETFYREGAYIWFEQDYRDLMAAMQKALFIRQDDNLVTLPLDLFEVITSITRPSDEIIGSYIHFPGNSKLAPGFVCPQLIDDLSILEKLSESHQFYNAAGDLVDLLSASDRKKINIELINSCRLMEKYTDGKAVFVLPVTHLRPGIDKTGCYGIVRNHHYALTLNSISGIGRGIPDSNLKIDDMGTAPDIPPYQINISFRSNPWIDGGNYDVDLVE